MVSIIYPNSPSAPDLSGFERGLAGLGGIIQERRTRKTLDSYVDSLYGPAAGGEMSLAALQPRQQQAARAPEMPTDMASQRVAQAHATSGDPVAYRNAIKSIESAGSGDYAAVGPTHPQLGRALGAYGVMEANIGPWSKEVFGREMTPEQFLANPKAQDAIFDRKFGGYVQKYGSPEKAAQAWFAGEGGIGTDREDSLGTSVPEYAQKFAQALGGGSGAPPGVQMAQSAPAASGGSLLPPREVMRDLLRNPETREFGILMAREAQKARIGDEEARLRLEKLRAEIEDIRNPNARDKFGNSVIWGQDAEGNWVAMQPSSGGGLEVANTPAGVKLSPPGIGNLDLGTEFGIRDRNGQIVNRVDKDLAGAEREKTLGKDQGEATALYESMTSKMPGLRQVADRLDKLAEQATYTFAGRGWDEARKQFGADPRAAATARAEYEAIIDNQILPLLRDTFGAQFTVVEGERLRSTLGDPNKSPTEKKAVLRAFIEQKERDISALATRTGKQQPTTDYKGKYGLE